MIPGEWINPEWDKAGKVHDWRNYISEELQAIWHTFTDEQKRVIAENADHEAGREGWQ